MAGEEEEQSSAIPELTPALGRDRADIQRQRQPSLNLIALSGLFILSLTQKLDEQINF